MRRVVFALLVVPMLGVFTLGTNAGDKEKKEKDSKEEKKLVGPLKVGMVFAGVFKSGELSKTGKAKEVITKNFELTITELTVASVDAADFVGHWHFIKGETTEVKGKVSAKGEIFFTFTKNIKGISPLIKDGQMAGLVSEKGISLKYIRPSGGRFGFVDGIVRPEEKK